MGIARLGSHKNFAILSLKSRGVMLAELSGAQMRAARKLDKEIGLAMHPRNFGSDKIGSSSTPHVSGCEMAHLQLGSKAYTICMCLTWYWTSM